MQMPFLAKVLNLLRRQPPPTVSRPWQIAPGSNIRAYSGVTSCKVKLRLLGRTDR
jgi:hypothetical protein